MKKFFTKVILKYLQMLTSSYVKRHKLDVVGLTGSVGKSSLTLVMHAVLSKRFKIGMSFRQGHGLNSETGIPLAILDVHVDGITEGDELDDR